MAMHYVMVPVNSSSVILYCEDNSNSMHSALWSIDLASDGLSTQQEFSTRRELLNQHGVYELPRIESAGMPPTLRLLINDTASNNGTVIDCMGDDVAVRTTVFVHGKY